MTGRPGKGLVAALARPNNGQSPGFAGIMSGPAESQGTQGETAPEGGFGGTMVERPG
jgi:hypothetical protein